jgi:hypothetical protein
LGDAWHRDYHRDKVGLNIVIARSEAASDVVRNMQDARRIYLEGISRDKLIESQKACLASKKRLSPLMDLLHEYDLAVPTFTPRSNVRVTRVERLLAWLEWKQTSLAPNRHAWWLLPLLVAIMVLARRMVTTGREPPAGARSYSGCD